MKRTRMILGLMIMAVTTVLSTGCHMTGHGMPPMSPMAPFGGGG